ncbi:hypothetical protein ACI2JA_03455 [Alkalihalobacillus sp. NPDC078783]
MAKNKQRNVDDKMDKTIEDFKLNKGWIKKSSYHKTTVTCESEKEMKQVKKYYEANLDEELLRQVEFRVV